MECRRSITPRDRLHGAALGLGFLGLYLATLCRTVFWYDSAEYVTAAYTLGIPHPPGYPLYTLLAHAFTWLPIDPVTAVHAMSAVFGALTVSLVYVIGRQLGVSVLGATLGAVLLGASELFWANAVVAEVYCPAMAVLALVIVLLLAGRRSSHRRYAFAAAFVAGLGLGIHFSIATCGLGLAWLVWAADTPSLGWRAAFARDSSRRRILTCLGAAAATLLGTLVFAYLPLRAAMDPPLNMGDPSTWEQFRWHITGGNYGAWFGGVDPFVRSVNIVWMFLDQFLVLGALLGAVGAIALLHHRTIEGVAFVAMISGNLAFFFDYRVHDLEVFFFPSMLVLAVLAGVGADAVLDRTARVVSPERVTAMTRLLRGAWIVLMISMVLGNYRSVDLSDFDGAQVFLDEASATLPPDAIIVNFTTPDEWKYDAVFGMYGQKVLGVRPDVEVLGVTELSAVDVALRTGRPVYVYVDHPVLSERHRVVAEGPLFRVLSDPR